LPTLTVHLPLLFLSLLRSFPSTSPCIRLRSRPALAFASLDAFPHRTNCCTGRRPARRLASRPSGTEPHERSANPDTASPKRRPACASPTRSLSTSSLSCFLLLLLLRLATLVLFHAVEPAARARTGLIYASSPSRYSVQCQLLWLTALSRRLQPCSTEENQARP
jgi:hypothetical protein